MQLQKVHVRTQKPSVKAEVLQLDPQLSPTNDGSSRSTSSDGFDERWRCQSVWSQPQSLTKPELYVTFESERPVSEDISRLLTNC
jgi:hypothetical protein